MTARDVADRIAAALMHLHAVEPDRGLESIEAHLAEAEADIVEARRMLAELTERRVS